MRLNMYWIYCGLVLWCTHWPSIGTIYCTHSILLYETERLPSILWLLEIWYLEFSLKSNKSTKQINPYACVSLSLWMWIRFQNKFARPQYLKIWLKSRHSKCIKFKLLSGTTTIFVWINFRLLMKYLSFVFIFISYFHVFIQWIPYMMISLSNLSLYSHPCTARSMWDRVATGD